MEQLPDFSKLFHRSSKDRTKGHPPIPFDSREWPSEWKTTYYKTYSRLPKISLTHKTLSADFFELVSVRKSKRDFLRADLSIHEVSLLLKFSCGIMGKLGNGQHRRAQPSGGGRYPIETYLIVFRSQESNGGLKPGLYHYSVKNHELDVLWEREFTDQDLKGLFTYPWAQDASAAVFMTSVFWRNQNKYGERGYRHVLLEAGHIGQNIYLVSEALGLKCCALSGTRDQVIEQLIDIDGVTESLVYTILVGK